MSSSDMAKVGSNTEADKGELIKVKVADNSQQVNCQCWSNFCCKIIRKTFLTYILLMIEGFFSKFPWSPPGFPPNNEDA